MARHCAEERIVNEAKAPDQPSRPCFQGWSYRHGELSPFAVYACGWSFVRRGLGTFGDAGPGSTTCWCPALAIFGSVITIYAAPGSAANCGEPLMKDSKFTPERLYGSRRDRCPAPLASPPLLPPARPVPRWRLIVQAHRRHLPSRGLRAVQSPESRVESLHHTRAAVDLMELKAEARVTELGGSSCQKPAAGRRSCAGRNTPCAGPS